MLGLIGPAILGAGVYVTVVVTLWVMIGRPDGAETNIWALARAMLRRQP